MPRFNTSGAVLFGLAMALAPMGVSADETAPGAAGRPVADVQSAAGSGTQAKSSDERVFIIDAPDLRKVDKNLGGPRFTTLIGQVIYSNSGRKIGKIEDFVMAERGEMYAVIDTSDGPIGKLVKMGDSEMLILPLRELRKAALPASKSK